MIQTTYDLIGDIHGHAGKLEALRRKLGYTEIERRARPMGWVHLP